MGWEKFAIRGDTYARALANAAGRAGRDVGALQPALSSIAAQPQAKLRPGLSSFVREPGVLPQTPQRAQMQDLAHRMPWAGDEHTTPAMGAKAEDRFNRLLDRRGLSQQTPHGDTQAQITQAFGDPAEFRRSLYRKDQTQTAAPAPGAATAVLPKGGVALQGNVTGAPKNAPSLSDASRVTPAPAASPNRFPRARFQMGKVGFETGLEKVAGALPIAAGVGIPLAVGGGMLLRKPGIQSNLKNVLDPSKGSTEEQDKTNALPPQAMGHAEAIHQALISRGLDPATMRIGVDAPPGSGKTTLARALAQRAGMKHYGLDWEPGNAWKSTIGLGRNVEKMPHAPRAGEILEHYLLNRTHDPDLFDAQIHIRRDPKVIREQLNRRGNAAYIGDMMDLDKSLGVADLGFDTLGGELVDIGDGIQLKLRPREGWGNGLDQQLMAKGIDPNGLSRHEKLLSLHGGKRTSGAGWTPYVKNPFSTGETLALGASIPLGVMAAKALAKRPPIP